MAVRAGTQAAVTQRTITDGAVGQAIHLCPVCAGKYATALTFLAGLTTPTTPTPAATAATTAAAATASVKG